MKHKQTLKVLTAKTFRVLGFFICNKTMRKRALLCTLLGLLLFSACKITANKTTAPDSSSLTPLPPEPQEINFEAVDGQPLTGRYYPASTYPAPAVVLMHWYPGDQNEWDIIARWLQNRGLVGEGDGVPWRDPAWFPEMPPDSSLAVFTFTFRGCAGGCQKPDPAGWLLDARAAMERATALPGVDPNRVVSVGASIGGDGAIAGCAWLVTQSGADCPGALSLSPGSYLIDNYQEIVNEVGQADPPRQAWCFYDQNEDIAEVCTTPSGDHYRAEGWHDGYLHGLHLLNPNADPNPLDLLLDFLAITGVIQP